MFWRKLALACLLGSLKCFSPDGSTGTPIGDNNASCGERPCKIARIAESQQNPVLWQAQEEVSPTTCKVCKFEYRNLENPKASVEMYGNPSFRLIGCSDANIEFYTSFARSVQIDPNSLPLSKFSYELSLFSHPGCVLFRFIIFGWFKDNWETKKMPKNLNIAFFKIPMLSIDLVWLLAHLNQLKSLNIKEQAEVSTTPTNANKTVEAEIRNIYMSLPGYLKKFFSFVKQTDIPEELLKPSIVQETWANMIENPFLFFDRVSKNIKRLKDLSSSYKKRREKDRLIEIDLLFNEKDLNLQLKENLEREKSQILEDLSSLVKKQKNELVEIVEAINSVLYKIENEKKEDPIENYELKVVLIMHIMNTCIHYGVNLCNYANVCMVEVPYFIKQMENNTLDFKTIIYNLGTRKYCWKVSTNKNLDKIHNDTVANFLRFINCTAPNLDLLKIKIITFWVAKVVFESSLSHLPLLCYILYEKQLMDERRIYMSFRYSFIIKLFNRLTSVRVNSAVKKCCFEELVVDSSIDLARNDIFNWLKKCKLVNRFKINPNLLFSGNSLMMMRYKDKLKIDPVTNHQNGKKDFIVEKVTNLFMNIYSEMNSIIDGVRNMLLNSVSDANQSTSGQPKDGHLQ